METAVNAVWDGGPSAGDRIVVIGAGVVGLLIGWLCSQIPGTEVIAIDVNPSRETPAKALGIGFQAALPEGLAADLVFHASGSPAGLSVALEAAGVEGTIVEVSWYGDESVRLHLGEGFHSRRLVIRSSQVARIPPGRAPRWDNRRRMALALKLLEDSSLDVLITGESDLEDLPQVMERLSEGSDDELCHRIRYRSDPGHPRRAYIV